MESHSSAMLVFLKGFGVDFSLWKSVLVCFYVEKRWHWVAVPNLRRQLNAVSSYMSLGTPSQ